MGRDEQSLAHENAQPAPVQLIFSPCSHADTQALLLCTSRRATLMCRARMSTHRHEMGAERGDFSYQDPEAPCTTWSRDERPCSPLACPTLTGASLVLHHAHKQSDASACFTLTELCDLCNVSSVLLPNSSALLAPAYGLVCVFPGLSCACGCVFLCGEDAGTHRGRRSATHTRLSTGETNGLPLPRTHKRRAPIRTR